MPTPTKTQSKPTGCADNAGVRMLLAAELRGNEVINEAKKRRQRLMKKARKEADEEIREYKLRHETRIVLLKESLKEEGAKVQAEVDKNVAAALKMYEVAVTVHKESIVERLMNLVVDVQPQIHRNIVTQQQISGGTYERNSAFDNRRKRKPTMTDSFIPSSESAVL
uniref:V-type proton ATPase subunit G n=1 Tax=Panagrellus redivivus TaxID=6233 RepID=A0A7E4VTH5_PANRE